MLVSGNLYHMYNRGNYKENIFFLRDNYIFFLKKIKFYISSVCDILCYCLMPNHFHFLIHIPEQFNEMKLSGNLKICLSSYAKAINVQEKRSGSLFQQHTKFKCLTDTTKSSDYSLICFNYIHQNPLASQLVPKMEDWECSSFPDYIEKRNGTLCNRNLALDMLGLPMNKNEFYKMSYELVNSEKVKLIF